MTETMEDVETVTTIGRATYSPDDNKLRLYPDARLSKELYARVKKAGFAWAPKQELFVAPMWTPDREDLLTELCGDIEDEDTSLVDRAEERAERFEGYSDRRMADAERAKASVDAIADGIPFGQPILVGHHSERHARKHKEQIERGTRRAVKMWETSNYWADRAAGALAHAKYKEAPSVRHRRIKGLESDLRKRRKEATDAAARLAAWEACGDRETALRIANTEMSGYVTLPNGESYWSAWSAIDKDEIAWDEVRRQRMERLPNYLAYIARWTAHLNHRIGYERAMLAESGGIKAAKFDLKVGGQIRHETLWLTITKVNKGTNGEVASVSTNNKRWPRVVPVERIVEYKSPTEEQVETTKAAKKLAPICNYPGSVTYRTKWSGDLVTTQAVAITQAEWDRCDKDYKATIEAPGTDAVGRHRVRWMLIRGGSYSVVFITDAKRKDPPGPDAAPAPALPPVTPDLAASERESARIVAARAARETEAESPFAAMKDALRSGAVVQTVTAPTLFPTPIDVARQVVRLAEIEPGMSVLEPSAGTGNLAAAVRETVDTEILAYEINATLCDAIRNRLPSYACKAICKDFLTVADGMGQFERVVMNPPFDHGSDIKHVEHALRFLKPGGRLVAIVANGPRQRAAFEHRAEVWIDLPDDTFKSQGTSVRTALVVLVAEGGE